jgi:hypothetical protein
LKRDTRAFLGKGLPKGLANLIKVSSLPMVRVKLAMQLAGFFVNTQGHEGQRAAV